MGSVLSDANQDDADPWSGASAELSSNVPLSPGVASPSSASRAETLASQHAVAYPQLCLPVQSEDDLLQEIQYLQQMLTDRGEEKRIQVAIARDELACKQRALDRISQQNTASEAMLRVACDELDRGPCCASTIRELLDQQQSALEARDEELRRSSKAQEERGCNLQAQLQQSEKQCRALHTELDACAELKEDNERTSLELHSKLAIKQTELRNSRLRLAWWEASDDTLNAAEESEIEKWEHDFWQASQRSLARLDERRRELRLAAAAAAAKLSATERPLCKICRDANVTCALLPCSHHAFCTPCCRRLQSSREPVCPLCCTAVTGLFETYGG